MCSVYSLVLYYIRFLVVYMWPNATFRVSLSPTTMDGIERTNRIFTDVGAQQDGEETSLNLVFNPSQPSEILVSVSVEDALRLGLLNRRTRATIPGAPMQGVTSYAEDGAGYFRLRKPPAVNVTFNVTHRSHYQSTQNNLHSYLLKALTV